MHVLMYADRPAGVGGIETHVASLSKELARAGIQVTVAFPRISRRGFFEEAESAGVRVLEMARGELRGFVAGERVHVVHAHSSGAAEWGVREAKALGAKLVVTLHGPAQRLPPVYGAIDFVVAVSEETAGPYRHLGERLAVVENGIDLERFQAGRRFEGRPACERGTPLRTAYLGRIGPAKKPGLLALHEAIGTRHDVTIQYLSDWAPAGDAEPVDDPAGLLAAMDVVFSTGRGIREALACGAAACVLGVYWDGLVTPENLDHLRYYNFSGRATRRRPAAADISRTVYSLLSDRRRLAELKRFGPRVAARLWDVKAQAKRMICIYREITPGSAS